MSVVSVTVRQGFSYPSPERGGWLRAKRGDGWGDVADVRPHPVAFGDHPPPQAGEG